MKTLFTIKLMVLLWHSSDTVKTNDDYNIDKDIYREIKTILLDNIVIRYIS